MRCTRRTILAGLLPLPALGLDPAKKKVAQGAETQERSLEWLRSTDSDAPLVYVAEMDYDFHKLLLAEIHRRKKISLPITLLEDKATFKMIGEVARKQDIIEREGRRKGFNGARHFATLTLVRGETGEVVWSCSQDDRNKFDFNSTGRTFRRVAERCVNLLVKEISGN